MKNRKGQALIEATVVSTVCVTFFILTLKFFINFFTQIENDNAALEKQVCKMHALKSCDREGGFVLVSMLVQLPVLVLTAYLAVALMVIHDLRWRALNLCFESGIESLNGPTLNISEKMKEITREQQLEISKILDIHAASEAPIVESDTNLKKVYYNLKINFSVLQLSDFYKPALFEQTLQCGAQRLCLNGKCNFSLIAAKS